MGLLVFGLGFVTGMMTLCVVCVIYVERENRR